MQEKADYIEGTTLQLDLWGDHFALLEMRIAEKVTRGRKRLEDKLEALKRRKRTLKRRLREAVHETSDAEWKDARGELEEAVDEFRTLAVEVYDNVRRS